MNDDLLDALVFLKHNDKKNPRKRPSKTPSKPQAKDSAVKCTPTSSKFQTTPKLSQASGSPKTPNNQAAVIKLTPGNSRSRMSQSNIETPKSSKPGSRFRQSHRDQDESISDDPVIIKRGRVENLFHPRNSTKKSRVSNVEMDESLNMDLDETQIQFPPNNLSPKSVDLDEPKQIQFGSKATPRTIRCTSGTSRSQSIQRRGSMFQAPQPSNSVFNLRSTRKDADETISLDPAIKERGRAQNFDESLNDAFFEESDNMIS